MSVIVIKLLCTYFTASWITSECTATELPTGQGGGGSNSGRSKGALSCPKRPNSPWSPPRFLLNE